MKSCLSITACNALSAEEEGEKKTCVGSDLARLCVWFLCNTWLSIQSHQWSLLDRLLTTSLHIFLCRLQWDAIYFSACQKMSATRFVAQTTKVATGALSFNNDNIALSIKIDKRMWDHLGCCWQPNHVSCCSGDGCVRHKCIYTISSAPRHQM